MAAGWPAVGIGFQVLSSTVPLAGLHAPAGATMVPLEKVAGETLDPIVPGATGNVAPAAEITGEGIIGTAYTGL